MDIQFRQILEKLAVPNYDNGSSFTTTDRLDAVSELLENTKYRKVNNGGLFEMYAANGILPPKPVLVSTHIDCVPSITRCFVEEYENEYLRGTFDNMITNAIIVYLMTEQKLDENIVVAFTGDEEYDSRGARDAVRFLEDRNRSFSAVILDVTDMGWREGALFSVENNFWQDRFGQKIINICKNADCAWVFVPSDVDDIPHYIPQSSIINQEALCDESWEYDESDIQCFSFCIPTLGEMHDNSGLLVRKESVETYAKVLADILNGMA